MSTPSLLVVTALVEAGAAVALLVAPELAIGLLLGSGLSSPSLLVVGRVTGAALMALGVASWLARRGPSRGPTAVVAGMLIYNLAVPILLLHAASLGMRGIALWPASILHAALAIWCIAGLRSLTGAE